MMESLLFSLKKRILPAGLMMVCILGTGCAPLMFPPVESGGRDTREIYASGKKSGVSVEDLERRIHELVNRERAARGLLPLAWNPALNTIARSHSQDMMRRGYFSHYTPEGHDLAYRYSRQGFVCEVDAGSWYFIGAENIFENNLYDTVEYINEIPSIYHWSDIETIAASTVRGWMSSSGHRKNILEPVCKTEGIGVAISSDHKVYITQDFC